MKPWINPWSVRTNSQENPYKNFIFLSSAIRYVRKNHYDCLVENITEQRVKMSAIKITKNSDYPEFYNQYLIIFE